ncbi:fimbria/pilus outer membrane usher protein [Pseudomonas helleri]|uniref:Fimbria/pilus outer membrane usher protein n=1 Tax=Pseudomonas helleri TaxID=1608996 RepID=A0A6A7YS46_9PSED|nr:fimbria/pilus outer membrane usher protein [Pseudomonas helleri]MQT24961.1 fimbria/pilus outer membrane usher protein [Pseudomonas helleri]MQT78605.1 fimbria/pilus outer membrane usher protein [Pseudomonas helleri]MQU15913.1 fimbria/pilus outer membrane usher protein [Pseudomonas helleri]MQU25284.1 fimbria/pilus outer membrane usher protein [Pseudomonas helleri]
MPFSSHGSCSPVQAFLQCTVLIGASITGLKTDSAHASTPVEFQSTFMRQIDTHDLDAGALALNTLSSTLHLTPGRYRVSIDINLSFFDSREIDFAANPQGDELTPCLSPTLLNDMGVKLDGLEQSVGELDTCVDIERLIPGATVHMDGGKLTLSLSIPQIAMRRDIAGYVDPQRWDYGINSAFVNYQLSAQQSRNDQTGHNNSHDLYVNSGLNLGVWRLRSNNTFRSDAKGDRTWSRAYTYLQRDLPGAHSQLTLGETFTPGDVFRSVPIRGVQIASDMSMLPDSQQHYAPTIRGVAQTRARLEIRQNGFPVYSTYVSAGPYEINDLTLASGSGELEIILTEADGQVRRFTQPYATLTNLLREGVWRYSASAGRYNAPFDATDDSMLWQGTLAIGTRLNSTLYGGLMGNDFYQAATLGIGKSLGSIGALSFDVTRSSAQTEPEESQHTVQGMSYSVKYGKSFETRTNLRFAGYRYSTEGYRDFTEAVRERSADQRFRGSRRSMLEASVFQDIGLYSSLSLIFSQENYWQLDDAQRQFQLNFSSRFNTVSYSLYASQSLNDDEFNERQYGLTISVPLEFGRSTTATYDLRQNSGQLNHRAALSGRAQNGLLNYRASAASNESGRQSAELSLGYLAPFASLGAGITQGTDFSTLSLNASGALLLHADGLETGPYLGETSGLIHVPNIANVGLLNDSSARTNDRGYALIPYLHPFRINRVILDTDQLDPNVEIDNGVTQVVPRRGAVVKALFPARKVERLLVSTRNQYGTALPFGAQISNADGHVLGIVGQAGQSLLSTVEGQQTIHVRWGKTSAEQCQAQFDTHNMPFEEGYRVQDLVCH